MTQSKADTNTAPESRASFGVRARLLLAFFAISAFAILAAAAGIYAFRQVGEGLDLVETRVAPTLGSLELSRSAERIIAAAPALLAATDRNGRDRIKAELEAEAGRLNATLRELKNDAAQSAPLGKIEPIVSSLTSSLAALEDLVARRVDASERIRTLRRGVVQTNDEMQRLLAPWVEVTGSEISSLVENRRITGGGDEARRLAALIELQRLTRTAQAQVSAVVDMLNQASTTEQAERLPILAFQLGLALRELEATAAGLDPKLRPLFLEQAGKLRAFAEGPSAIAEARKQELAQVGEGEKMLAETGSVSSQLTAAVDLLGSVAKQDIGSAIRDALSVQRLSTRTLIALVALSVLTSVLIVWLYVGGNIVRRLTALNDEMLAIADGKLHMPVAAEGSDEIAAMGRAVEVFRRNAIELERLLEERQETAARLEQVVDERTRELSDKNRRLETADKYKSHFLASASHDLRQPLHALNLFVAQLRAESDPAERSRLVARIDAAINSMNELFGSLLDMTKLDAGILESNPAEFPVARLLHRIEMTFAEAAREKGLSLRVISSSAWVRSDFILLERMLLNLVSNAIRYTAHGGVVIGCRYRAPHLRIDVCDSGPGVPEDQHRKIFGEFYQLTGPGTDRRTGLGLGLAIVDRLGLLLGHAVELNSRLGRGSRFSITLPLVRGRYDAAEAPVAPKIADLAHGKLVVVIDDDALVLEGMGGILRGWGCEVVTADSGEIALAQVAACDRHPDLIISDYRLANGKTGIEVIERVRDALGAAIPALLISGDTAPERLREASSSGYYLLHKPVPPMRLRATLNQLLKVRDNAGDARPSAKYGSIKNPSEVRGRARRPQ